LKNYIVTPEDFLRRKERQQILKTCRENAELDLIKGRQTWPVRFMLVDLVQKPDILTTFVRSFYNYCT